MGLPSWWYSTIYLLCQNIGGKLFRTWEFPRSGSKAEDGEKKERKKDRTMAITMAKLRMAHASRLGQKAPASVWKEILGTGGSRSHSVPNLYYSSGSSSSKMLYRAVKIIILVEISFVNTFLVLCYVDKVVIIDKYQNRPACSPNIYSNILFVGLNQLCLNKCYI